MAAVAAKIAPSMLSSDFANLASEAERMVRCGADWLHMDIMENDQKGDLSGSDIAGKHFVPNLTIGAPVIESLRKHTKAYLDCHLMVTNPLDYVEPLAKAGASGFTFHVEATKDHWKELVRTIKTKGMRPGVALKPATSVEEVFPLAHLLEQEVPVRTLRKKYPSLDIEVDGGLGPSTISMAASAGANCIVAGSSVFGAAEPAEAISILRKNVEGAQQKF
ncbi:Ribulose-phosphate 3-epimerase, cytoplasmic isoform [Acorus calamus]|uniref:ribulose-phosphate 3-epimerase n=1 Tax=Acorus calamus TaxID=4465 RepID=A0AAV9D104_ACOCL|nr:Ribulose-phosphate 3-epimerase, cytoplasmic isoform [Acorus calamus]